MKRIGAILGVLLTTSTVLAGSYDFECTGFRVDKATLQISKITMTRSSATLDSDPGLKLEIVDPNVDLVEGVQTYVDAKKAVTVKATVIPTKQIVSVAGNLGARDHTVEMNSVLIKLDRKGSVESFAGTCTETTISSCGGSCN